MSNISNIKNQKLNLIDSICEHCKVPSRFNHTMKKTLLKLNHSDIANLFLGIVAYKDKPNKEKTDQKSYKIIRFFKDDNKPNKVILTGLTLEQAQNHCQDPDTSGDGWFDGYDEHNLLGYNDEPSCLDCDDSKLDLYGDDCYCTKKRVTL